MDIDGITAGNGKSPSPCSKSERIFPGSQPAIAGEIVAIGVWCLAASFRGAASGSHERRAYASIDVVFSESLI